MFLDEKRSNNGARSAVLAGPTCLELGYGRFMQTDPLGYGDGLNWYAYAGNDPVNNTDPTGTMLASWEWSCYGNCGGGY